MTARDMALSPLVIRWLEDRENRHLLHRLINAEEAVGDYGKIEITYHQGRVVDVITRADSKH